MVLEFLEVSKTFDGIAALSSVSIQVAENEVVGLIGPNGSGKTTAFNIISGLERPDSGDVILLGQSILSLSPHEIAWTGLSRVFQNLLVCPNLTILDNVALGAYASKATRPHRPMLPTTAESVSRRATLEELEFVGLAPLQAEFPARLSRFDLRKVEIARSLVSRPRLLLLDEPTSGFSRNERNQFAGLIESINSRGIAVLIIEHDLTLIREVSGRVIVLDVGRKIAEGNAEGIARNKAVAEVYLGTF